MSDMSGTSDMSNASETSSTSNPLYDNQQSPAWLAPYHQDVLAVDLIDGSIIYGRIKSASAMALVFENADLHDMRESNSTKEVYGLETQNIGVRVNRKECTIPMDKIISICFLSDLC